MLQEGKSPVATGSRLRLIPFVSESPLYGFICFYRHNYFVSNNLAFSLNKDTQLTKAHFHHKAPFRTATTY